MLFKLGEKQEIFFATHNPFTGNAQDADTLPIAKVFRNNDNEPFYLPSVRKVGDETGVYAIILDMTASHGFEFRMGYNVMVEATVVGKTAKARVAHIILVEFHRRDLADVQYRERRVKLGSKQMIWERIKP